MRRTARQRPEWPAPIIRPRLPALVGMVLAPEARVVPRGPPSMPRLPQPSSLTSAARAPGRAEPTADAPEHWAEGAGARAPGAALAQEAAARATATALHEPLLEPLQPGREPAVEPSQAQAAAERINKRQRTQEPGAGGGEGGQPQAPLAEAQPERPLHEPVETPSSRATAQLPMEAQADPVLGAAPRAPRVPAAVEPRSTAAAVRLPAADTEPAPAALGRPSKQTRVSEAEAGGLLQAPLAEAEEAGHPVGRALHGPGDQAPGQAAPHSPQPAGAARAQAPAAARPKPRRQWPAWAAGLRVRQAGAAPDAGPRGAGAAPAHVQRQALGGAQQHVPPPPMGPRMSPLRAAGSPQQQAGGASAGAQPMSPLLPGMPAPAGRASPGDPCVSPGDPRLQPAQAAGVPQQQQGHGPEAQLDPGASPALSTRQTRRTRSRDPALQPAQAAGVPQQQVGPGPEAQPDPGTSPTQSTRKTRRNRQRLSGPPQRAPEC